MLVLVEQRICANVQTRKSLHYSHTESMDVDGNSDQKLDLRPPGYNTFSMLNSAEHELYPVNKNMGM